MPQYPESPFPELTADEFERQFARWGGMVFRYLVHLVGPGVTAEDLFQETWMKAIEHHHQLRDPSRFAPWILRIARNRAFNHKRQNRRRGQVWILSNLGNGDGHEDADPISLRRDDGPDPREQAIHAERRRILESVLTELEPEVQEMLQLRYFENLTLAEVASVLGVPLGTVCTKVHRSLRVVREQMQLQGYSGLMAL